MYHAQANAPFLRPGSAAVELIQRNWVWHGLDKSFQVAAAVLWAPAHCSRWIPVMCRTLMAAQVSACISSAAGPHSCM